MFKKSLLQRMQLSFWCQAFDGDDLALTEAADIDLARANRRSLKQNGTSAATPFAASVLGAGQVEVVAQDAQECAFAFGVNFGVVAIEMKLRDLRHTCSGVPDVQKPGTMSTKNPALISRRLGLDLLAIHQALN